MLSLICCYVVTAFLNLLLKDRLGFSFKNRSKTQECIMFVVHRTGAIVLGIPCGRVGHRVSQWTAHVCAMTCVQHSVQCIVLSVKMLAPWKIVLSSWNDMNEISDTIVNSASVFLYKCFPSNLQLVSSKSINELPIKLV